MIRYQYGFISELLSVQAEEQGCILKNSVRLEKILKSILMLRIHRYVTEKQKDKMIEKLHKDVLKNTIRQTKGIVTELLEDGLKYEFQCPCCETKHSILCENIGDGIISSDVQTCNNCNRETKVNLNYSEVVKSDRNT